ncbi:MAG: heptaprenylglyceryl phosphate synthase [Euryarchaeota archaeon]|nr:heptaprenylglyceryl phosphate synthase [Euryarchaeota archaeon]
MANPTAAEGRDGGPWRSWRHVTKLDPDRPITPETVRRVVEGGTDAIMVSGTLGVTRKKVARLREMIGPVDIPVVLEPSDARLVEFEGFDRVFVPTVLNSGDPTYIAGKHAAWAGRSPDILWERVVPEAYIVLNPDSAVGRLTRARPLDPETCAGYARVAERYFQFPIVYMECSGALGDPRAVQAIREKLTRATLFYGGGIDTREKAQQMARWAHTIVVGNVLYEKGIERYLETIVK